MTEHNNPPSVDLYFSARENLEKIITDLQSSALHKSKHGDVEAYIQKEGRELQRLLMQAHLNERSSNEEKQVSVKRAHLAMLVTI